MKRIYEVAGVFFENKEGAAAARGPAIKPARVEKVNGKDVEFPAVYAHKISKGPDHWRFGVVMPGRTHSHNCRSGGHGNGFPAKRK